MADSKPQDEPIQLIITQNGANTKLKVKAGTKFSKIFAAFFKSKGIDNPGSFKFMFDGKEIKTDSDQTPFDLDMEDESAIDCLNAQTGGCVC